MFDPYRKWLGIPDGERPPTHYQLLGISPNEHDADVIDTAVLRQSSYVRNFQTGKFADEATRVLNEIAAAKVCLLDPARRAEYDAGLKPNPPALVDLENLPAVGPQRPVARAGGRSLGSRGVSGGGLPTRNQGLEARNQGRAARNQGRAARNQGLRPTRYQGLGPVRKQGIPLHYWLVPAILGAVGLIVVIVIALAPRGHADSPIVANLPTAGATQGQPDTQPGFQLKPSSGPTQNPGGASPGGAPAGAASGGGSAGKPPGPFGPDKNSGLPDGRAALDSNGARSGAQPAAGNAVQPAAGNAVQPAAGNAAQSAAGNAMQSAVSNTAPPAGSNEASVDKSDDGPRGADAQPAAGNTAPAGLPQEPPAATTKPPLSTPAASTPLGTSTVKIPLLDDPAVVFAKGFKPLVAVASDVFNLKDGKTAGQTGTIPSGSQLLQVLSSDGKYYAVGGASSDATVEIRLCATGQRLWTLRFKNAFTRLKFVDFGEPDRLVTSTSHGGNQWVQIWNLETGKQLKEFKTFDFDADDATLSDDGRYLAACVRYVGAGLQSGVAVFDLKKSSNGKKGKFVAMKMPPVSSGQGSSGQGAGLGLLQIKAPRFSADGNELAVALDDGAEIVCWNIKGEIVFDHHGGADMRSIFYRGPPIEWSPDGKGWLLNGKSYFDRQRRRVIWVLDRPLTARDELARFLDPQRLVLSRGEGRNRQLGDAAIPWNKINASLAASKEGECYLGPNQPVGLAVSTGNLIAGGEPGRTATDVEGLIAARLRIDGIRLGDNAPAVLHVRYSEELVQPPPPPQLPPGLGRLGGPAFSQQQAPAYNACTAELTLRLKGESKPLYSATVRAQAGTSGNTDRGTSARDELYADLRVRLRQASVPYFIPKDPELTMLPAVLKP